MKKVAKSNGDVIILIRSSVSSTNWPKNSPELVRHRQPQVAMHHNWHIISSCFFECAYVCVFECYGLMPTFIHSIHSFILVLYIAYSFVSSHYCFAFVYYFSKETIVKLLVKTITYEYCCCIPSFLSYPFWVTVESHRGWCDSPQSVLKPSHKAWPILCGQGRCAVCLSYLVLIPRSTERISGYYYYFYIILLNWC